MMEKSLKEYREKHYNLKIIFFFVASICVGAGIYEIIPLTNVLMQSFHVQQEKIILISSMFSLFYAIGFIVFGWLANHIETKKLLISGSVLLMITTFFTGFKVDYTFMMVLRAFQGLFAASFAPLGFSIIVKTFPQSKRITGISAVTTGFVMAGVLGQLYGSLIIGRYPWAVVFRVQAIAYAIMIVAMILILPKTNEVTVRSENFAKELGRLLINKKLSPCYFITLTLLFSFVGMYTIMGAYFQSTFNFDPQKIIMIRSIGIIGMIGSMLFVKLSKKIGAGNILSLGLVCASISVLIMGISSNVGLSVVMSVLFVFGITVSLPMIVSSVGVLAGKQSGNAMTLYTFILFIGATVGPILCNRIMGNNNFSLSFIFLAVVLGISSFVSGFVRKNV